MEAVFTRCRDQGGPSTGLGKWSWVSKPREGSGRNDGSNCLMCQLVIYVCKGPHYGVPYSDRFDHFLLYSSYSLYYQNITKEDIVKLYEKFKPDFLMFGYTLKGFI